jgi:hypothetical protein
MRENRTNTYGTKGTIIFTNGGLAHRVDDLLNGRYASRRQSTEVLRVDEDAADSTAGASAINVSLKRARQR